MYESKYNIYVIVDLELYFYVKKYWFSMKLLIINYRNVKNDHKYLLLQLMT